MNRGRKKNALREKQLPNRIYGLLSPFHSSSFCVSLFWCSLSSDTFRKYIQKRKNSNAARKGIFCCRKWAITFKKNNFIWWNGAWVFFLLQTEYWYVAGLKPSAEPSLLALFGLLVIVRAIYNFSDLNCVLMWPFFKLASWRHCHPLWRSEDKWRFEYKVQP